MRAFFFPSSIFGGHEMMASKIVKQLSLIENSGDILVVVNRAIYKEVRAHCGERCRFEVIHFFQTRFENVLGFFNPWLYIKYIRYLFFLKGIKFVTIINGGLSANHCTTLALLLACKTLGLKSSIYYPMFHSAAEVGLSGIKARSYMNAASRTVYLTDLFITIDNIWAERLLLNFPIAIKKTIRIVHNYVE
ncbi:hypothetical protein [Aeromonas veronii]|uniref:hypothetical protein n=1 Tax=Aeromonas veronii TaxID=654 RepID=UPI000DD043B5|nr:hypothetical protein [Aeromonas veronii]